MKAKKKPGPKPKSTQEKKVQVIYYVRGKHVRSFKKLVEPILGELEK